MMVVESEKITPQKYITPEGLTRSQRRNYKKGIREKEKKKNVAQELEKLNALVDDPLDAERHAVISDIKKQFQSCPMFSEMKAQDVLQNYTAQQSLLESLLTQLSDAQERLYSKMLKMNNRRVSSAALLERLKKLQGDTDEEKDAIEELNQQVVVAVAVENARKAQTQFNELKQEIEKRIKLNNKLVETLRYKEHFRFIASRIVTLKSRLSNPVEVVLRPDDVKCIEYNLPAEMGHLLVPPYNITSELSRLFCVVFERSSQQQKWNRSYTLYGLPDDVQSVVKFIATTGWTNPCKVKVTQKELPHLFGKGYREKKQLEETCGCILLLDTSGEICIYGPSDSLLQAQQQLEKLKSTRVTESLSVITFQLPHLDYGRALKATFGRQLRKLEENWNVMIRCVVPQQVVKVSSSGGQAVVSLPFGGDCTSISSDAQSKLIRESDRYDEKEEELPEASVMIRGTSPQKLEGAKKDLLQFISTWTRIVIPTPQKQLEDLYNGLGGVMKPVTRLATNSLPTPYQRFNVMVDLHDSVAFLKDPQKGIVLVGPKDACEKIKPELEDIVEAASFESVKLRVPWFVAVVCCSLEQLHVLEDKHHVTIRKSSMSRSSDAALITITGAPAATALALEELEKMIELKGQTCCIRIQDDQVIQLLSRPSVLRSFERQHHCRLFLNKTESSVTLVGESAPLKEAQEALPLLPSLSIENSRSKKTRDISSRNQSNAQMTLQPNQVTESLKEDMMSNINSLSDQISLMKLSSNGADDTSQVSSHRQDSESFDSNFPSIFEAIEVPQGSRYSNRRRMKPPPKTYPDLVSE